MPRSSIRMGLISCIMAGFGAVLFLSACQPPPSGSDGPVVENRAVRASVFGAEGRACIAEGGRPGRGGLWPDMVCFHDNEDAGKACTRASECVGVCVVQYPSGNGQCSAVRPMFGCYQFFDEQGEKVEICVD